MEKFCILNKVEKYKEDIMFICENGSVIYHKDKCISSKFLDKKSIESIVSIGREIKDAYLVLCGKKALYLEDPRGIELLNDNFPTEAPVIKVDSLLDVEDDIFSFKVCNFFYFFMSIFHCITIICTSHHF